jgi:hypothetical protein
MRCGRALPSGLNPPEPRPIWKNPKHGKKWIVPKTSCSNRTVPVHFVPRLAIGAYFLPQTIRRAFLAANFGSRADRH